MDSTQFPDYGEFRSFALGGMLAVIVALPDSSLMLSLLKVIIGKTLTQQNHSLQGNWWKK